MSYAPSTVWAPGFTPPIDLIAPVVLTAQEIAFHTHLAKFPGSSKHSIASSMGCTVDVASRVANALIKKSAAKVEHVTVKVGRGHHTIKHYSSVAAEGLK